MKKTRPFNGLQFIDTLIQDTTLTSEFYFKLSSIPNRFTSGKNFIRIKGNADTLVSDAEIKVEAIDANGNPIYFEFPDYVDEDGETRFIVFHVYDNTAPGNCIITIIGKASIAPDGSTLTAEQQADDNLKWQTQIAVDPAARNNTEIIYINAPIVTVEEKIQTRLSRSYSTTQFVTQSAGKVSLSATTVFGNAITYLTISGSTFIADMVGGTVEVAAPVGPLPLAPFSNIDPSTIAYRATINSVLNSSTAVVSNPYVVRRNFTNQTHTYVTFQPSDYNIYYEADPILLSSTLNSSSYGLFRFRDLDPMSGDVYRMKFYIREAGTIGNNGIFEQIDDVVLEPSDLLTNRDQQTKNFDELMGQFVTQSIVNAYWQVPVSGYTAGQAALQWNTVELMSSMFISASLFSVNQPISVVLNPNRMPTIYENTTYELTFTALAKRDGPLTDGRSPKMSVYYSGSSAFINPIRDTSKELGGRLLRTIEIDSDRDVSDYVIEFQPDANGTFQPIFLIEAGAWYLQNIKLRASAYEGFTPNHTEFFIRIPPKYEDFELDFRIEYYDYENKQARDITLLRNVPFSGSVFVATNTITIGTASAAQIYANNIGAVTLNPPPSGTNLFGNTSNGSLTISPNPGPNLPGNLIINLGTTASGVIIGSWASALTFDQTKQL